MKYLSVIKNLKITKTFRVQLYNKLSDGYLFQAELLQLLSLKINFLFTFFSFK